MCSLLVNKGERMSPMLYYIESPNNILVDNLSWLHCLDRLAQIAEEKKLIEPVVVSDSDDNERYFLDQELCSIYDDDLWKCILSYLNLPESNGSNQSPLNCPTSINYNSKRKMIDLQVEYPDN